MLDKDKKIAVQQKLIEQLTKENAELREQILYSQSMSDDNDLEREQSIKDMNDSKEKYDKLIVELDKLKADYQAYHKLYKSLAEELKEKLNKIK